MNPRDLHVNKTQAQRQDYWRYIEGQDYEPTVDEKLAFARTGQIGEELSEPSIKRRRPVKLSAKLSSHISENWLSWLFAIGGIVLLWIMVDSKIAIAKIDTIIESVKETISGLQANIEQTGETNSSQDLRIEENRIRMEYLERELSTNKLEKR